MTFELGAAPRRLLAGIALAALFLWSPLASAAQEARGTSLDGANIVVPDFAFTERSGEVVTNADLLGEPWIASLFFSSCAGPCPALNANIRRHLHDQLEGTGVRIVSFSVDPAFDTPERLRDYANTFTADSERWLFLTGDELAMHEFVRTGLKLAVAAPEEGSEMERLAERLQVTHATRLLLIDATGKARASYEVGGEAGLSNEEIEANFVALHAHVRRLDSGPSKLPLVNALLNGMAAVLLVLGLIVIKRGQRELHGRIMRAAFLVSAAFLASYLYYHFVVLPISGGPTRYNGEGIKKILYLVLLASHVLLAIVNLPMVLRTLWLAHREDWERHRRLARWTWPLWMYVSVTGVLVYLVLYRWNPAPG